MTDLKIVKLDPMSADWREKFLAVTKMLQEILYDRIEETPRGPLFYGREWHEAPLHLHFLSDDEVRMLRNACDSMSRIAEIRQEERDKEQRRLKREGAKKRRERRRATPESGDMEGN